MIPLMVGGGVVLVLVVIVVVLLRGRSKPKASGAAVYRELLGVGSGTSGVTESDDPEIAALRQNLRVKLLYQEDKVDAAIEFERERDPAASNKVLMKAAIERWERDNR